MNDTIQFITLALFTVFPNSLFLLGLFDKIFRDKKTDGLKTICLGANETLIKGYFQVKTILFDNLIININSDQKNLEIIDRKTNKELTQKGLLLENEYLKMIAATTNFCSNKKTAKIEEAILNIFNINKYNKDLIEKDFRKIDIINDEKEKKITTTIIRKNETEEIFAFSKGNPYKILELCTRIIQNNKKEIITPAIRHKLKKQISKLNKKGQKVIAFSIRPLPLKKLDVYTSEFTEKELIFIGFIGVERPLNTENEKFIEEAKSLGLKILLITQLKERTASAIASEMKIINKNHYEAISGEYFETLNEQKKEKIILEKEKDYIFCETNNKVKEEIIRTLEEKGQKPILINKKTTIEKTLENYKKNLTIKENLNKTIIYSISYKLIFLLILLIAGLLKLPSPYTLFTILYIDIIITLPIILYYREKKFEEPKSKTFKIIASQFITQSLLLGIMFFWVFKSYGYDLFMNINQTDNINLKISEILLLWFSFTQFINIFFTFDKKEKHNLINYTWLILIILSLLPILFFSDIKGFFQIDNISVTELILILSCLGIYTTSNYIIEKIK